MAMRQAPADELIPTRATLLSRLKDWEDQESWSEFFNIYWKLIYKTALKYGLQDAEAQDVVQETIISVSKSMPGFRYDPAIGSFKAWLLRLTRWRIRDQHRRRNIVNHHETLVDGEAALEAALTQEVEAEWNDEYERNLVDAAMERVKMQVDPKQFQIFDLYVLKEWPVKRIADLMNVAPPKIYLVKHRISKMVKREALSLNQRMS